MPLHLEGDVLLAVKDGEEAVVKMLLEAEADPNAGAWNRGEHTAVSQAIVGGHEGILDALLNYGPLYGMKEERGLQTLSTKTTPEDISITARYEEWLPDGKLSVLRDIFSWLPKERDWMSPAERALRAIQHSRSSTESMVIKLLDAGLLASQPYRYSEVARKLLNLALDRFWPALAAYLLDRGAPVDLGPTEAARDCYWPSTAGAIAEAWPDVDVQELPDFLFYCSRVLTSLDEYYIERSLQVSTWAKAVSSPKFKELLQSDSDQDRAIARAMFDIIHRSKADPSKFDDHGLDALSYVVRESYPSDMFEKVLQAWYEKRKDLGPMDRSSIGTGALYFAINNTEPDLTRITRLLDMGVSTEWENEEGRTPLWQAAYMNESRQVIDILLSREECDPNNGGSKGYPPILRALNDNSHDKFVAFLEAGANPNIRKPNGQSILQVVLELDPGCEVLKNLCLESLMEYNVEIWDEETQSAPALDILAAQLNSPGLSEYMFQLLIDQIPPNARAKCFNDALRAAVRNTDLEFSFTGPCLFTIFYFIQRGADPRAVTDGKGTLLHAICSCSHYSDSGHEWHPELDSLLKRKAIDINARDEEGYTALSLAVQRGSRDFVLLLLFHGADPNIKTGSDMTPLQMLVGRKCNDYTLACSYDEVEGGSRDDQYDGERGQAAWHFISRGRRIEIMESLDQEETFQTLCKHGADLKVLDNAGRNLLMIACTKKNSVLVANILYAAGQQHYAAHLQHEDHSGQTAYHLAAQSGCIKTMRILLTPSTIFDPTSNIWRMTAVVGEAGISNKEQTPSNRAFETLKAAERQRKRWEEADARIPSNMKGYWVRMERPEMPRMTVGSEDRKTFEGMYLPNVSVQDWDAPTREETFSVYPQRGQRSDTKTPLQRAAENGHLEMVKLLLGAVELDSEDVQQAAYLALAQDFYDIYAELCEYSSVGRPKLST